MKKLKILIVTKDYPPPFGGIATITYCIEQELKKLGFIVKILNFDSGNTNNYRYLHLRDFFYTAATRNSHFGLRNILNPVKIFKDTEGYRNFVYNNLIYRVCKKEINNFKPDIIHITSPFLFCAVFNITIPFIVSCHSEEITDSFPICYSLLNSSKFFVMPRQQKI